MRTAALIIILVTSFCGGALAQTKPKSAAGPQVDLKTAVAEQVERLKVVSGISQFGYGELPEPFPLDDSAPLPQLVKYGEEAVPYLIPYLSDKSLTQACRVHSSGWSKRVQVNEYIIESINRITQHNFYLPPELSDAARRLGVTEDPAMPKSIEELQAQVNQWWKKNRSRTLLDRKIDDVSDPVTANRFAAYEWLGRTKAQAGRLPLEQRIETLLEGEVNSLKQSEMATCAESLGMIRNVQSADIVRKVCDHLAYWVDMSYRPISQGRAGHGSMQLADLFKALHGLAALSFKDEALSRLEQIESKYYGQMDQSTQAEFRRNLETAKKW